MFQDSVGMALTKIPRISGKHMLDEEGKDKKAQYKTHTHTLTKTTHTHPILSVMEGNLQNVRPECVQ